MASSDIDGHLARLILLVDRFSVSPGGWLVGLTKLAKLDFLLRYPTFMESLSSRLGLAPELGIGPTEDETLAVSEPMIRYRYGPWDNRYYPLLGALVGRGFAEYGKVGGALRVRLTSRGKTAASQLRSDAQWQAVDRRSDYLARHYDISGTQLKNAIYEHFPIIKTMDYGDQIEAAAGVTDA